MNNNEKPGAEHIDAVESVPSSDLSVQGKYVKDANEEIVEHLQTTGEEVGMTWRSIMAAIVSLPVPNTKKNC